MVEVIKRKRDQAKCSECRKQRVKCTPSGRDWDADRQKCDKCISRHLDCSPSFTKKEDPLANPAHRNDDSNEPASSSTQQTPLHPFREGYSLQNDQHVGNVSCEGQREEKSLKDREERPLAVSSEQLRKKTHSKLERLNAVGIAWNHNSNAASTHCGAPHTYDYEKPGTINGKFKEYFHTLFIKVVYMIEDIDSRGYQDMAYGLMVKLLLVWQKYPGLYDDQKRGGLLGMALFFKKYNDRDEYEYVLGKMADMVDPQIIPINRDRAEPSQLLAESLLESDGEALTPFWKKHFAKDNMPSDVVIPPPQRAAQYRNPKIAEIILSTPKSLNGAPAISNLESVHIAAAMGNVETLSIFIEKADGQNVDARDAQAQTPLFLAAANGRPDCCRLLLQRKADPNSRDRHGHTIAEVAARSGNLKILKMLVAKGANLHAPVSHCASTPLQAAIESKDPSEELVQYLLDGEVDVSAQRWRDKETAISLAEGKGLQELALRMRNRLNEQDPMLLY